MIAFVLDLEVTGEWGLNKLYAGVHWSKRKHQAEQIHGLVQTTLRQKRIPRKMFSKPVSVRISYNSRLDIDNHGCLSKLIIDGLKGYLIEDDRRKYIRALHQCFWSGEGVLVEIFEKGEEM
mgnify:CR=1 FL=1